MSTAKGRTRWHCWPSAGQREQHKPKAAACQGAGQLHLPRDFMDMQPLPGKLHDREQHRSGVAQVTGVNLIYLQSLWWKWDQHVASNSIARKYFNQSILFAYPSALFHFYFSCPSLFSATSLQTWLLSLQGWRAVPSEHINLTHFHEYQLQAGCQKIFLIFIRVETQFYVQTLSQVKSGGVSSKVRPAFSFSHSLPPCW